VCIYSGEPRTVGNREGSRMQAVAETARIMVDAEGAPLGKAEMRRSSFPHDRYSRQLSDTPMALKTRVPWR
jgi:hypothetical protein